ncbi:unnamed protein product [Parnassius mnemosyne]|uniref:Uncharacterized protein n=1 Tax=Parnassius mnemosyne TaxID=213953 RepID=A0AAV1KL22_9NEOP
MKDSNNYGPYNVAWGKYDVCHGPKRANVTKFTTSLTVEKNNHYIGVINITFLEQTVIEEFKMSVFAIKEKRKILLWNQIVVKPCQHFALAAVIETYVDAKNCVVRKGSYNCNLNFTETLHNFIGTSFFYGEFMMKTVVFSKKGNIACLIFNPIFTKKTT